MIPEKGTSLPNRPGAYERNTPWAFPLSRSRRSWPPRNPATCSATKPSRLPSTSLSNATNCSSCTTPASRRSRMPLRSKTVVILPAALAYWVLLLLRCITDDLRGVYQVVGLYVALGTLCTVVYVGCTIHNRLMRRY